MTRMEMWKDYREEIAKNTNIGYAIMQDSQNIEKYKKEIDKINPAILANIKTQDLSFVKGVSEVKVSQTQVPTELAKMFSDVNKARTFVNYNKVATTFDALNNLSILDKDKKLKEAWLLKSKDYEQLMQYVHESQVEFQDDKEIEANLKNKYTEFSSKEEMAKIEKISQLDKDNQGKQVGHYVYVISVAFAIFAVFILFVLLVLRFTLL